MEYMWHLDSRADNKLKFHFCDKIAYSNKDVSKGEGGFPSLLKLCEEKRAG